MPHIDFHYVSRMHGLAEEFFMSPDNPDCYNYASDSRHGTFRDCRTNFAWQFVLVAGNHRRIPALLAVACDVNQ